MSASVPASPAATTVLSPAARELRLAPGSRLGRFELVGLIGRGGMGEVWVAVAPDESAPAPAAKVALKVLGASAVVSPDAARRFEKERELLGRVSHPGIVRTLGPLEQDAERGLAFFPMELVLGKSLADLLAEHGRFPVLEAVRILVLLAGALEAVHATGIVHRDVKPSNVLLDRAGRVRLTDFGLARAVDETRLTAPGSLLGTPAYMAPEQARGEPSGPEADLYAAGVLAHELVAGAPPFAAPNALALLRQHAEARPAALRTLRADVPEALEALVLRLLEKDARARGDAARLRADLEALHAALAPDVLAFAGRVQGSLEQTTRSLEALGPGAAPARARTAPAGLLGAGVLVGLGLAGVVAGLGPGAGRGGRGEGANPPAPAPASSTSTSTSTASPGPAGAGTGTGSRALVKLRDGRGFAGTLVGVDAEGVRLRGPDGVERRFGAGEVDEIAWPGSASR